MENDAIKPFRRLQSTEREEIGFLVVDPSLIVRDFTEFIPGREWEALGVRDKAARLALAICIIGPSLAESSGNLQAPVIINYQTMTGRQIILTEAPVSPRQPLL
jgi:flagellar assembly factor FliW